MESGKGEGGKSSNMGIYMDFSVQNVVNCRLMNAPISRQWFLSFYDATADVQLKSIWHQVEGRAVKVAKFIAT